MLMQAQYDIGQDLVSAASIEQRNILEHAPIVKRIARQLSSQINGVMAREDIEQIGLMGLLDALRRYGEPDANFGAYAATRVRGAILDELRCLDWRSRGTRENAHRLRDAERRLNRELGHEPSVAEMCEALCIDAQTYQDWLLAANAHELASFDEQLDASALGHQDGPEAEIIRRDSLARALRNLTPKEQRVIQLYYEFDLNLREVAAVLDLTESRICQINKSALEKMRHALEHA